MEFTQLNEDQTNRVVSLYGRFGCMPNYQLVSRNTKESAACTFMGAVLGLTERELEQMIRASREFRDTARSLVAAFEAAVLEDVEAAATGIIAILGEQAGLRVEDTATDKEFFAIVEGYGAA